MARDTLLTYPNFNETFKIHINPSAFQLGAVISQKGGNIAFYGRKLTDTQQRYPVTEREVLSIVETLKGSITILLGQNLIIYTDHKNLTCKMFNNDISLRWILILEKYGPDIEYIKGDKKPSNRLAINITLNGNEETTHKSTYQKVIVSEINDIEKLPEGTFPINLKVIPKYQRKEPSIIAKYKKMIRTIRVLFVEVVIIILTS